MDKADDPISSPAIAMAGERHEQGGGYLGADARPLPRLRAFWLCGVRALMAYVALCLANPLHAAYRVEIDAPDTLRNMLSTHLELARYKDRQDLNEDQLEFMLATAAEDVAQLVATEGYFSPQTTVTTAADLGTRLIRLSVDAGPRTHVAAVALTVAGAAPAQSPAQVAELRRSWSLTTDEPFRQEDWDEAKQGGLNILRRQRYAAASIVDSAARVHANEKRAELSVDYDSGPLFTLGQPVISGARRYPESIARNVNPLASGEEYSLDRLLEFQRQILRTPYYSNVVVDIDRSPANANLAPLNVQLTEHPAQRIRSGVGYTSDTGGYVEGRYSHYNLFDSAWVLDARLRLEQRRQSGELNLAMPPDTQAYVNSLHGSTNRTTLEGIDLRSRRISVRRARDSDKRDIAYSLDYYRDTLEQLNGATPPPRTLVLPGTHRALVAGVEYTWRRVDSLSFPRQGYLFTLHAGLALKEVLSDQTFSRIYLRLHRYLPIGRRDLAILRGELGAVVSAGGNAAIPASLLFRAGGSESVRGYRYQSIGNLRDGTVYPARYLATGGIEYQHWRTERWGGAVFYDVGKAADVWRDSSTFQTLGLGVRWRSPAGRISADLAYGLEDKKLRPHLSLGVAF